MSCFWEKSVIYPTTKVIKVLKLALLMGHPVLSCRVQKHLPGFPLELIVSLLHNSITTGVKES